MNAASEDPAEPVRAGDAGDALAVLRREPDNPHLFGGFGPLILALLVALVITLAIPSVAPERIVRVPAGEQSDTTTTTALPP